MQGKLGCRGKGKRQEESMDGEVGGVEGEGRKETHY